MKVWWKSLTLWFNGVVLTIVETVPLLVDQLPAMKAYLPDNIYKWAFITLVLGNAVIRARTNTALGLKDA